jgi:hypothetical protein
VRFGFLLGLLCCFPAIAQTTVAGSTPGSFRVTESGAAEYRIPLRVPPGVAGMEPKLALAYNSQAGNGLLGVGWNLEGLSAITRCPRTMAQDGVRGGVNYNADDRFCLDGQRLIALSGTEYRTERESFSKIVSYGTAGNGPAWFKVWTKSGQIIEYGNTTDSRIEAQGKQTVRVWAVNKVADTKGNYFNVTYTEDEANGDHYPARIDYAATAAGATLASVRLGYQNRTDVSRAYVAGSVVKTMKRLTEIRTYVGESQVRNYALTYDNNGAAGRSRLVGLAECLPNGACLPAHQYQWLAGSWNAAFSPALYSYANGSNFGTDLNYWQTITGDFNGDGRTDLARVGPTSVYVYLSTGDGAFSYAGTYVYPNGTNFGTNLSYWYTITGDFNGDGRTDFARVGALGVYVYMSVGDGTFSYTNTYVYGNANFDTDLNYWQVTTGDFDGDGRTDLARIGPHSVYVYLSTGDGMFSYANTYVYPNGTNFGTDLNYWRTITGDFNGDGRTDFARVGPHAVYVYLSLGGGTFSNPDTYVYANGSNFGTDLNYWQVTTGDFNGDGRTDLARVGPYSVYVYLSTGEGMFSHANTYTYPNGTNFGTDLNYWATITGDLDGDGRTDIARVGPHAVYVYLSLGDGTFSSTDTYYYANGSNFGTDPSYWQVITGDFSGDGRLDLLRVGPLHLYAYLPAGPAPDLLSSIDSGGRVFTQTYQSLTSGSIHTRDAGSSYPVLDLQLPLYVVSSASSGNGTGGTATSTFQYGGLKAELGTGRGSLGFRFSQAVDAQTEVVDRIEYRQDWPYVGLPALVRKTQSSGAMLREVANAYATIVVDGNRYFPFVWQSEERGRDLNGAALPTVTSTRSYDPFGNPIGITIDHGDHRRITTNTYSNDTGNWRLGRLLRSTVQSTGP